MNKWGLRAALAALVLIPASSHAAWHETRLLQAHYGFVLLPNQDQVKTRFGSAHDADQDWGYSIGVNLDFGRDWTAGLGFQVDAALRSWESSAGSVLVPLFVSAGYRSPKSDVAMIYLPWWFKIKGGWSPNWTRHEIVVPTTFAGQKVDARVWDDHWWSGPVWGLEAGWSMVRVFWNVYNPSLTFEAPVHVIGMSVTTHHLLQGRRRQRLSRPVDDDGEDILQMRPVEEGRR